MSIDEYREAAACIANRLDRLRMTAKAAGVDPQLIAQAYLEECAREQARVDSHTEIVKQLKNIASGVWHMPIP